MSLVSNTSNLDLLDAMDVERSKDDIPLTDLSYKVDTCKQTKEDLESTVSSNIYIHLIGTKKQH